MSTERVGLYLCLWYGDGRDRGGGEGREREIYRERKRERERERDLPLIVWVTTRVCMEATVGVMVG